MDSSSGAPYILLLVGGFCFLLAVVSTITGKAWSHNGRPILRDEEPGGFWVTVAGYCVGCLICVGYFFGRAAGFFQPH